MRVCVNGAVVRFSKYENLVDFLTTVRKNGGKLTVWYIEGKGWAK